MNVCAVITASVWAEPIRRIRGMEQGNASQGETKKERRVQEKKAKVDICPLVVINNQMLLFYEDGLTLTAMTWPVFLNRTLKT